jgi:hypothetical protein
VPIEEEEECTLNPTWCPLPRLKEFIGYISKK